MSVIYEGMGLDAFFTLRESWRRLDFGEREPRSTFKRNECSSTK
jgi:hypothetical protein